MEVMHRQTSSFSSPSSALNPNAPIFIPMASYLTVEDFSDQWWDLIHSSPSFRHYWLHDCFIDPQSDSLFPDTYDLEDFNDLLDLYLPKQEKEEDENRREKELISMGALKWNRSGERVEPLRNFEKVPKIIKSVRLSPRTINQPR